MRLAVDARMYGLEHAGIGRYVMNLVDRLVTRPKLQLTLFLHPQHVARFKSLPNVKIVTSSIRHYSLAEQVDFLRLLNQHSFDLLHTPHFNLPYFYNRPFVVTIHDILWHQVRGANVTTLSPMKYMLKYQGYRLVVNHAVTKARAIFVPSNYVKQALVNMFPHIPATAIHVTYEGVDKLTSTAIATPKPYLVYIGSAYPHKNIPLIFQALAKLPLKLKLVGSRSVFLDKLAEQAKELNVADKVEFLGPKTDAQIVQLLTQATALVHPSKSEGFGLTGLEAMAAGCPVIAARATALPEIYGQAALYCDPDNPADLIHQINTLIHDPNLRQALITKGRHQLKNYSWDTMVDQTIAIYHQPLGTKH